MRDLLLDTSVLLKWFHREGEDDIEEAEWHLHAHREAVIQARVLDLGLYELGNVMVRALNRTTMQTPRRARGDTGIVRTPIDAV